MMNPSTAATKRIWLVIFFLMVFSPVMGTIVCFVFSRSGHSHFVSPALGQIRPAIYGLAAVCLVAGIFWTQRRVGQAASRQQFQTASIVGLALTEACAVLGTALFFLGAPLSEFLRFAGMTIVVDLLFLLPAGLRYWSSN